LRERSVRYEERAFLIEGKKLIEEAIRTGLSIEGAYVSESFLGQQAEFVKGLGEISTEMIPAEYISRLSSTSTFPGILAVVRMPDAKPASSSRLIACLDGINDPGNLGTMIRTAEWFGVEQLILGPGTVDPYNEKVVRSAMGSLFRANLVQSADLVKDLQDLKQAGYVLVAAEAHGSHDASPTSEKVCLIMGSESHGITPAVSSLADRVYTIPGKSETESLNVAVSFGIILHQLSDFHE
jgi:TrmH family RNA methyltransferase